MTAQDPDTHGMERGDPDALGTKADQVINSLAHLSRGLVGKSDRKNIPGVHAALIHKISDPVGDHPGLSAAGAGQDQDRSLSPFYGLRLLFI